jgi:hypothetical protein
VVNKIGFILNIARRFFYVNLFLQIPTQEGAFNIHLMGLPSLYEVARVRERKMDFILDIGEKVLI